MLEVSCTQILALTRPTNSVDHDSHPMQFKYSEFYLPNSKEIFFRRSPTKTPFNPSRKKGESSFNSPFSVSSEELEFSAKSSELERQKHFEPLETDLNALFLKDNLKSENFPSASRSCPQSCEIPDHPKSIVADCGFILF